MHNRLGVCGCSEIIMSQSTTRSSFLLFLLGLGCMTKVFLLGTIALSELVIFFVAPFWFLKNYLRMRREGFLPYIYMLLATIFGMLVSAAWNHTPYVFTLKQFAVFYGFFAYYTTFYCLLHDNFKGIGWFFLGAFISGIITVWILNPRADVSTTGFSYIASADVDDIIHGQLFWIGKFRSLSELPIFAAYLKTPIVYSILTPIFFVAFAMLSTVSGRAQSMCVLLGGGLMLVAGKSRVKMRRIGRHVLIMAAGGVVILLTYKAVYSYAASRGYLGEDARVKYEQQTNRGKGAFSMLVAGRTEFFIALTSIWDHPIIGFGPRPEDTQGYMERFLLKYGTEADIRGYYYYVRNFVSHGARANIPSHSHIMGAWLWCGIAGLVFFLWIFYVFYQHFKYYISAIPHWYGYFVLTIPSMAWSILFNPIGDRYGLSLLMVCIFFSKAVVRGKIILPREMEMEARKAE